MTLKKYIILYACRRWLFQPEEYGPSEDRFRNDAEYYVPSLCRHTRGCVSLAAVLDEHVDGEKHKHAQVRPEDKVDKEWHLTRCRSQRANDTRPWTDRRDTSEQKGFYVSLSSHIFPVHVLHDEPEQVHTRV